MAVDADAAVAPEGGFLLGCGQGALAARPLGGFGGELGGHAHHLGPGAAPEGEGGPIGIDQPWPVASIEGAAVMGQHHNWGGK